MGNLYAQTLAQRLLVPVYLKYSFITGYDNNILKLSNGEMENAIIGDPGLGNTLSFDSGYLKPSLHLIYSPQVINDFESNIIFKISQAAYNGSKDKNYYALNSRLEFHFGSYQWLKFSYNNLPNYYLRHYRDKDSLTDEFYGCSFTSETMGISYSHPITNNYWLELGVKNKTEFYNSHFTEFDLIKNEFLLGIHKKFSGDFKTVVLLSTGKAKNPSYNTGMVSTQLDRSYLINRWEISLSKGISDQALLIQNLGINFKAEERYYDLASEKYLDNWKYYFESKVAIWIQREIYEFISMKCQYHYTRQAADSNLNGDFDWISELKDYSKHEISIRVSYLTAIDFYY